MESKGGSTNGNDAIRVGEIDGLWTFITNIDWSEPWLLSLVAFHVFCLVITVLTKKHNNFQIIIFLIMLLMIYLSEYLNEYAAKHYRMFSRLQYFDSGGLFISVVYNVPLLINCLIMICLWLLTAANLMIVMVKRGQLEIECLWLHTAANMIVTVKRGQLKEKARLSVDGTSEGQEASEKDSDSKKKD